MRDVSDCLVEKVATDNHIMALAYEAICKAALAAVGKEHNNLLETDAHGAMTILADVAGRMSAIVEKDTFTFTPDAEGEGDAVEALIGRYHIDNGCKCKTCQEEQGFVTAARSQRARERGNKKLADQRHFEVCDERDKLRAELEELRSRVGQAEGYEALYRGVCEHRDELADELARLRKEWEGERVVHSTRTYERDAPFRLYAKVDDYGTYAIRRVEEWEGERNK